MTAASDLQNMLRSLEQTTNPTDEHHFYAPLRELARKVQEQGDEPISNEFMAEAIAFQIHSHDHQQPSNWGLYFGPMMSGFTQRGEPWDAPSLSDITMDTLRYWAERAGASAHPVMRARYADLLWELPKALDFARPNAEMARTAVDAYLDAVETHSYEHPTTLIGKAQRALSIALSVGDQRRASRARDVMLALEVEIAEDDSLGLWGFCFDAFVEPPHKVLDIDPTEVERLVESMEDRLVRLAAAAPSEYHPAAAQGAALRLANYYRRLGKKEDMTRVLREYGATVRRMQGTAAPLVVANCLEELYGHFKAYGVTEEADALSEPIRVASEESLAEMKPISVEVEISKEQLEEYFAAMLAGDKEEILTRISVHFIPKRDETKNQVRRLAQQAPISYLMTHSIIDNEGRTIATVGPLDQDLEGHVIRQLSQNMHLAIPWLRETFDRGLAGPHFSEDDLTARLLASPLFDATRHPIIQAGVAAYCRDEALAAVHILIPQIENAVRRLGQLVGAPIYTQRRGGGLHARTLDDLLRDPAISAVLGDDASMYFRVLLTDARGWNLRNDVCHGLAPASTFGMPAADRVLHVLLALGLIRKRDTPAA